MVKYSLTLTASAEILFGILAKLIPTDDLHVHVEEIVKQPSQSNTAWLAKRVNDPAIRFDKRFDLPRPRREHGPPQPKRAKRKSDGLNLTEGINKHLMDILEDGKPHNVSEFKGVLEAIGYSPNSVGSRLQALHEFGIVKRLGAGKWRLVPKHSPPIIAPEREE